MIIDISNTGNGHQLTDYELVRLQSGKIYNEIKKVKVDTSSNFNFMIIPMSIFNILEHHDMFKTYESFEESGLYFVGTLYEFKCYVDLTLNSNQIIMKYDKQISRDNKLNEILNGVNIKSEFKLEVLLSEDVK